MTKRGLRWLVPLVVVAIGLAVGLAHLASSQPDGLEQVAQQQGFANKEQANKAAPMPDYEISALGGPVGKTLAGLAGVVLAFGLALGVGRLLSHRRRRPPKPADSDAAGKPQA